MEDSDDRNQFFKDLRLSPIQYAWLARCINKRIEERYGDATHLLDGEVKVRVPITLIRATELKARVRSIGLLAMLQISVLLLFGTLDLP